MADVQKVGNKQNKRKATQENPTKKKRQAKRRKKSVESSEENLSYDEDDETEQVVPNMEMYKEENSFKLPEDILTSIIKEPGSLLIAGKVSWDLPSKDKFKSRPNLYSFRRFTDKKYRYAVSNCSSFHSVLITDEGQAYTFGRNTFGQLGLGDTETRDTPQLVEELKGYNIIQAATGRNHTLFLTDTGAVFACGDNKSGQCGIGTLVKTQLLTPTRINHFSSPIIKIACGADFSMILDMAGSLYSFGLPEYGQLGHNTDGKYFVTSNKTSFRFETSPKRIVLYVEKDKQGRVNPVLDVFIVDMACGVNHTVAVDSNMRTFSWGFGGYGRLGHAEPKDELVPRLITFFQNQKRRVHSISCGGTFTLVVNDLGFLMMFGQTKRSGEPNMYPKPIQDLNGWVIKSVGAGNSSIVVAADESLVSWGPSPTCGELGLGDTVKSSPRPAEVRNLKGVKFSQVSMGHSHSLVLCSDFSEEAVKKLAKLQEFSP